MPARLLFHDSQGREGSADLSEKRPAFLGRGNDCLVRTDDALVSRRHCRVAASRGKFFVEDLGSANGTFVNEQRVKKHELQHGDVIRCGSLQVRFANVGSEIRSRTQSLETGERAAPVDPVATLTAERDQARARCADLESQLEALRGPGEAAQAELTLLREKLEEARRDIDQTQREHAKSRDELAATQGAAEEMAADLARQREEITSWKTRYDELTEELEARERQLDRMSEDSERHKRLAEELRERLVEVQKTKDEGWQELNSQLTRVEQLEKVMREQERLLEERRLGLVALEATLKELRAEKERRVSEPVETRRPRGEPSPASRDFDEVTQQDLRPRKREDG